MSSVCKGKKRSMAVEYEREKLDRKEHMDFMRNWVKRDLWLTICDIDNGKRKKT